MAEHPLDTSHVSLCLLPSLRKDFVILQLYCCGLVAQNIIAEIWSNAW